MTTKHHHLQPAQLIVSESLQKHQHPSVGLLGVILEVNVLPVHVLLVILSVYALLVNALLVNAPPANALPVNTLMARAWLGKVWIRVFLGTQCGQP